jgi:MFS family permease
MSASAASDRAVPVYRVQSLVYDRRALAHVLFWMLWGDFCLTILESVMPAIVPLQLRRVGAQDSVIGLIASSLPAFVGILLNPMIGLQSDRHRGRLGRRRPFLLWSIGPVLVGLLLLGAAQPAGEWIYRQLLPLVGERATVAGCTIVWISGATILFVVFNTYVLLVYQFLFADVIPPSVMGKFIGLYRAVGAVGGFVFNRWIFRLVEGHTFMVYALTAAIYATGFGLLVWRVKEGPYPPVDSRAPKGRAAVLKTYFRECYRHSFYLNIYLVPFFYWSALVPFQTFMVFFATRAGQPGYAPSLGLSLADYGRVQGWTLLAQIPVFVLIGPVLDRFHPLRVIMIGACLTSLSYIGCFWFITDEGTLLGWWLATHAFTAIYLSAYLALFPRLLPPDKYGQFFSANTVFGFVGVVLSPVACGWFLGAIRDYRYLLAWCGVFTFLSFAATVSLFVRWKSLGGDQGYRPPGESGIS